MTKKILYATLVVSSLFFTACDNKSDLDSSAISTGVKKEDKIFQFSGIDGKSYTIKKTENGLDFGESLKGKAVLLNFFATWCPPCKAEIPHLIKLQEKYGDKFAVFAACTEDDKTQNEIKEFIQKYGINYEIVLGSQVKLLGEALGGIKSIPFMILYSTSGKYITHYVGAVPIEMIEHDLTTKAFEGQ